MVLTVKPHEIDLTVYGIRQVDYTLDGTPGTLRFDQVVAESSFQQAAAVDEQTQVVVAALKLRQRKTDELGQALALLDGILCSYKGKPPKSSDLSEYWIPKDQQDHVRWLFERVTKYGNTITASIVESFKKGCKTKEEDGKVCVRLERGTVMRAQASVEQMIDIENNNMQQEMISLQGFVSKRDKAYENAQKVIKKYNNAADAVLKVMRS